MARPTKPTALKLVGGNAGKRALPKQEPDPAYLNDLTAPAHLAEDAQKVWAELAAPLRNARLLTELDTVMLEFGCNAIAMYRKASEQSNRTPLFKNPETGNIALNPWTIVQAMSSKQAMAVLREFGMSPAARSKVISQPQGDLFGGDSLGDFLRKAPAA